MANKLTETSMLLRMSKETKKKAERDSNDRGLSPTAHVRNLIETYKK